MPLSAAEKQRKYREKINADPKNREMYLAKERDRWHQRVDAEKVLPVARLSERENRRKRRTWRKSAKKYYKSQKLRKSLERMYLSPPVSPDQNVPVEEVVADPPPVAGPSHQNRGAHEHHDTQPSASSTAQKRRGRKIVRRDRAQAYRTIEALKQNLASVRKSRDLYKKRWQRATATTSTTGEKTPRKKARLVMKDQREVRRTLVYHFALTDELRQKISSPLRRDRQLASKTVAGKILKKYRYLARAKRSIGLSYKQHLANTRLGTSMIYQRKYVNPKVGLKLREMITNFYLDDRNSRMTTGKKDTVTHAKQKKQKRLLNDTIKNLHRKFETEFHTKISYSSFRKLKPFWVVCPSAKDRDTCLCKICENGRFMLERLIHLGFLDHGCKLTDLMSKVCCDPKQKECCYRECEKCLLKSTVCDLRDNEKGQMVNWWKWNKKAEAMETENGSKQTVQRWIKEECNGTLSSLVACLSEYMCIKICKHLFNVGHQLNSIQQLRSSLLAKEAILHIDFAENWVCKYSQEIQSVHFGASHDQATLHNVVVNLKGSTLSFCTISDSRRHDCVAIWTYLAPVLEYLQKNFPEVETLHVQSDGPTTQYRNKGNLFMTSTRPFYYGFKAVSWSFSESGHGKGAPDGIGATVKRTADSIVAQGFDIPKAETLYSKLKVLETRTILMFVSKDNLPKQADVLPNLKVVQGTMKMHQAYTATQGQLYHRVLSCHCKHPRFCDCFAPKLTLFQTNDAAESRLDPPIGLNESRTPLSTEAVLQPEDHAETVDAKPVPDHIDTAVSSMHLQPIAMDDGEVGKWCIVLYDDCAYPGEIVTCEDEVEVNTMESVGFNRFIWPLRPQCLWYDRSKVLGIIPAPRKVSRRRDIVQVEPSIWENIQQLYLQ